MTIRHSKQEFLGDRLELQLGLRPPVAEVRHEEDHAGHDAREQIYVHLHRSMDGSGR